MKNNISPEALKKYVLPKKISDVDYIRLSKLTIIFAIITSVLPYIVWLTLAHFLDHDGKDLRYQAFALMTSISMIMGIYAYKKTSITVWIYTMVILYTIMPFSSVQQSFIMPNNTLFIAATVLLALLRSWKTIYIHCTLSYLVMAIVMYYTNNYLPIEKATYRIINGELVETSWLLTEYSSLFISYCTTLVIGWFVDYLVRSTATTRQEAIVAYNQLDEKKTQQDHMFAIIGHELRTPIAASNMMIEDVLHSNKNSKHITSKYYDTIISTKKELEHTLSILDDMKIVSSADTLKEYKTDNDYPAQNIRRSIKTLESEAKKVGLLVSLKFDRISGQKYKYSSTALTQLSLNIIKNAIRHSKADTLKVRMTATNHTNTKDKITISYKDNGIGIPERLHERVFDAFYSRDKSNTSNTGLGLFIVKELSEVLDAKMTMISEENVGTEFIFEMVLEKAPEEDIFVSNNSLRKIDVKPWMDKRVLVVEDNLTIQAMTVKMLTMMGAVVDSAGHGEEALYLIEHNNFNYDIILTDYFMPYMNGVELTTEIRKQSKIPIIGITAATVGSEVEEMKRAGVDVVIPKPATKVLLDDAINTINQKISVDK